MVSKNTVNGIVKSLLKFLSPNIAVDMLVDLAKVPGNKSFKDTMEAVRRELVKKL